MIGWARALSRRERVAAEQPGEGFGSRQDLRASGRAISASPEPRIRPPGTFSQREKGAHENCVP